MEPPKRKGASRKETTMRQITMNIYSVGTIDFVEAADGRYDKVKTVVCEVENSSLTKTEIRAAIKEAGVEVPRGIEVFADKVGTVRYYFETEDLLAIAKNREVERF